MRPEYRDGMVDLAMRLNAALEGLTHRFQGTIRDSNNVNVSYSDSLFRANVSTIESISNSDAWHPSPYGHRLFAEGAYSAISQKLSFGSATVS